jgi:hypothetical protein
LRDCLVDGLRLSRGEAEAKGEEKGETEQGGLSQGTTGTLI